MSYPETKISSAGNLWVRQMRFEKVGDFNKSHEHNYDHFTLLAYGSIRVHVDGQTSEFKAPHMIFITKGKTHSIEALEDGTVAYCVHALRNKDTEDILNPDQIPTGVDAIKAGLAKPL